MNILGWSIPKTFTIHFHTMSLVVCLRLQVDWYSLGLVFVLIIAKHLVITPTKAVPIDISSASSIGPTSEQCEQVLTPLKFNIAREKWCLEDYFPSGKAYFQGICWNSGVCNLQTPLEPQKKTRDIFHQILVVLWRDPKTTVYENNPHITLLSISSPKNTQQTTVW